MPHIHEKIDFCADTFIVNGDAVLLRKHEKYGTWFPPGGHVELDEDPEQAAVREVKEEVGLDVALVGDRPIATDAKEKEVLIPRYLNRHFVNETHEHISFIYFGRSATREVVQGENEKSDEIRWFTKRELIDPSFGVWERVRAYANAALDELAEK